MLFLTPARMPDVSPLYRFTALHTSLTWPFRRIFARLNFSLFLTLGLRSIFFLFGVRPLFLAILSLIQVIITAIISMLKAKVVPKVYFQNFCKLTWYVIPLFASPSSSCSSNLQIKQTWSLNVINQCSMIIKYLPILILHKNIHNQQNKNKKNMSLSAVWSKQKGWMYNIHQWKWI